MKTDNSEPTLIKKRELAKRLSVSPRTIEEWTQKRIIPRITVTARLNLYDFDEVMAVLKERYRVGAR